MPSFHGPLAALHEEALVLLRLLRALLPIPQPLQDLPLPPRLARPLAPLGGLAPRGGAAGGRAGRHAVAEVHLRAGHGHVVLAAILKHETGRQPSAALARERGRGRGGGRSGRGEGGGRGERGSGGRGEREAKEGVKANMSRAELSASSFSHYDT